MAVATLVGYVSGAESRFTLNGTQILDVRMACNVANGREAQADWYTVTIFGPLAAALESHIHKGTRIQVIGDLVQNRFEGQDGTPRCILKVKANKVLLLSQPRSVEQPVAAATAAGASAPVPASEPVPEFIGDDDVPF